MTCLNLLEQVASCLGLLEETITLFEWTNISAALFECLGLLEVNRNLLGVAWTKVLPV